MASSGHLARPESFNCVRDVGSGVGVSGGGAGGLLRKKRFRHSRRQKLCPLGAGAINEAVEAVNFFMFASAPGGNKIRCCGQGRRAAPLRSGTPVPLRIDALGHLSRRFCGSSVNFS